MTNKLEIENFIMREIQTRKRKKLILNEHNDCVLHKWQLAVGIGPFSQNNMEYGEHILEIGKNENI